jgi:hypothetical protein
VAERFGLGELTLTSILSGRTEERFERLVGPMTSPWPLPVPLGPLPLAEAAQMVSRAATQLAELAVFYPGEAAVQAVPAFAGLPADTYFSDVAINFTSYERHSAGENMPQVVEVLGPVDHPLLAPSDFAPLAFPSGLHLIFDVSRERATPSLWFHTDRFGPDVAAELLGSMTALLRGVRSGDR